jgi:serine/threonine protein kinase
VTKLIIVPIGEAGRERFKQSKLKAVQAAISEPLQESPDAWELEELVRKVRQAIDPTRIALEERLLGTRQPFQILKSLSRGNGARLFLAEATLPPNRTVVIKAIEKSSSRWEFYESLRDSAKITDLPNVVPLYTADLTGVPAHYVMRFVPDGSLRKLLEKSGKQKWDRVQQILLKLGRAVASARERGLLSRFYFDLRPSHILLEQWEGNIEPFLSFVGRDTEQRGTRLIGSLRNGEFDHADEEEALAYVLPEQLGPIAGPSVSPQVCDVYLLGLIGYQMLTGKLPAPPDTTNLGDDEADVTMRFPHRQLLCLPSDLREPWSDRHYLAVVIEKMIAISPWDRFPDIRSALSALEHPKIFALDQVRASYMRSGSRDKFFKSFYARFFDRCPEMQPLFSSLGKRLGESARWRRQTEMVDSAISILFSHFAEEAGWPTGADRRARTSTILSYFAGRHQEVLDKKAKAIGLTVDPAWFDAFVESLADSACASSLELSGRNRLLLGELWRQVLRPGSDAMKQSHATAARSEPAPSDTHSPLPEVR